MLKFAAVLSLLLVAGGVITYRLGLLPFAIAFYGFGLGLILCSLLSVTCAAATFRRLARRQPLGNLLGVMAVTVAPVLLVVVLVGPEGFQAPPIHDITTDLDNPPAFTVAVGDRNADENSLEYGGDELAELQRLAYPVIAPVRLDIAREEAQRLVREVISELGWKIVGEDEARGQIEAMTRTPIMGFTDDIVVRITPVAAGVVVDIRSASRVGVSDLGANARRIRRFIAALQK